ncbi:MAG: VWA domain-containing protein, partial [bacterium]
MKKLVSTVRSGRKLTDINSALELALQELRSDRANPLHIPVVILLTDGEIDVVEGTPTQKRLAAQRSEKILLSKTLPAYPKNYIPIYTIALKSVIDTSLLQILAERSKLPQQVNEEHYFQVSSGADLVEIFSKIISQIKKQPRVAEKFHFTGEPIKQTTTTTPFTKKIGFDVILDHKENMDITLKNPEGEIVEPTSQEKKYN